MMNLSVLIITILTEITHSALSFQMVVFVLLVYILQSKLYTGKKNPEGFLVQSVMGGNRLFLSHTCAKILIVPQLQIPWQQLLLCHITHHSCGFCSCPFPSSKSILRSICTYYFFYKRCASNKLVKYILHHGMPSNHPKEASF